VVLKSLPWALAPPCGCLSLQISLQTLRANVVLGAIAKAQALFCL
jgi:hypothetical protein